MTQYMITRRQHASSLLVSGLPPGRWGKVKEELGRRYPRPIGVPPMGARPTIPVYTPPDAEVQAAVRAALGDEYVVNFPRDVQSFVFNRIEYV